MEPRRLAATKDQVEYELHEHRPLRMRKAAGDRIECTAGVIWITVDYDPVDIFLPVGGVFVVPNHRLVLVEAMGHAQVRIASPRRSGAAFVRERVAARLAWLSRQVKAFRRLA
jgi:hypothetical protein